MLWLVLILAVIGGFIYVADKKIKTKFEDKFNPTDWDLPRSVELTAEIKPQPVAVSAPAVKLGYAKHSSVLSETMRPIFNALQQAVEGEYSVLTNVNATAVLVVNADNNTLAMQVATKNLAAKQFDFVLCEKAQLAPVCAIMVGDSLEPLLVNSCEDAQLPLARFKSQTNYDVAVIRASLFKALGRENEIVVSTNESALEISEVMTTDVEQKADIKLVQTPKANLVDGGINLELCPECSSVMLKRKAKNGNAAGKLFWICSTYPKCRGMLPVK